MTALFERVQELHKIVNESAENYQRIKTTLDNAGASHNALVGRLNEATELYEKYEKTDKGK
ncbi:hypothetical protein UFOVP93_40 [uncultured Caudovirales phage]|uniref:Uncharacterized protein n=1 Tax=uncultured Caudovirales phage TaxID=2100421 RepID=A0A6J5L243_9CAUD|nr:hypothetical protein UFOVP93_40 [uncultured Caudovirales phage]